MIFFAVGKNSSFIPPPFLNLMSNIVERAGSVNIRCGGNTQEKAVLVATDSIANGSTFAKQIDENSQATVRIVPFSIIELSAHVEGIDGNTACGIY
jgi:hypothetical protein